MKNNSIIVATVVMYLYLPTNVAKAIEQATGGKTAETELKINGSIQVQKLKITQHTPSVSIVQIKITNKSKYFLEFVSVSAAVYNSKGEFLGNNDTNVQNLRPQQETFSEINFWNIKAGEISSWKPQIKTITVQSEDGKLKRATKYFELEESK